MRGKPNHPANFGRCCTKAATPHLSARRGARALDPELRRNRSARRAGASWHEAPDHADVFFVADSNAGARAVQS